MDVPDQMFAMVLHEAHSPLVLETRPVPKPGSGELLICVKACGVCRTDLHIYDGELAAPKLPLVLGHEITGVVAALGEGVQGFRVGERVGVPWLGWTCGECWYCLHGQENLCDHAKFTGYTLDGGFAEFVVADARFIFCLPDGYSFSNAAPLMCAGLIGYRSYRMAGEGLQRIGIYGFGAAAHLITQLAVSEGKQIYAFTRPGDLAGQEFALQTGAVWAGGSDQKAPDKLDAGLLFAPVGALVPAALQGVRKGGMVVCGGIYMSDIPSFPYQWLWEERVIRSVANLTRQDGLDFMAAAGKIALKVTVESFSLAQANEAIKRLKSGEVQGAAVLEMG